MTAVRRVTRRPRVAVLSPEAHPCFVGLDPSLTGYGVVLWFPKRNEYQQTLIKTPSDWTYARRLMKIRQTLGAWLSPVKADIRLICMERPAYNASGAFTGGLVHAATAFALVDVFGIDAEHVAPVLVAGTTLKKFVTGKGNGPKSVVVKGVYKTWGFDTDDDNVADACGLAHLAERLVFPVTEGVPKYQQESVLVVRKGMSKKAVD